MEPVPRAQPCGAASRAHVILIPGFAGFDALGQVHYYTGTSRVFREWLASRTGATRRTVLHYFDSLPSGAVATRAERLHKYLAKRIARNEFQPDDRIVLVGHSTGGLDIRHLLMDLAKPGISCVDGSAHESIRITNEQLLGMIRRVVFVSTPHYGSNIVDDWLAHTTYVKWVLTLAVLGLHMSVVVPARTLQRLLGPKPNLDAWYAIQDTLLEVRSTSSNDAASAADVREAFAQVTLWLRQMASDFSVLTDLRTDRNTAKAEDLWPEGIITRSYATVSPPPSAAKIGVAGWLRAFFSSRPKANPLAQDPLYRSAYDMTAKGGLERRIDTQPEWFGLPASRQAVGPVDESSNDGIVNTASMLWKHGGWTRLVLADHGDIIGHYRRDPEVHPGRGAAGRRFESYDFFRSGSKFDRESFETVWNDIFTFCGQCLEYELDVELQQSRSDDLLRDVVAAPKH
jgi:triacylglycerol lipase